MALRKSNPPFLNGVPEMLLLELLSRQPMYGYQLVQAIKHATDGQLEFGEGCIYPILHRLESHGVLKSARENVGGRERVVYRLTAQGRQQLGASVASWQRVVRAVDHVLQGGSHGRTTLAR